VTAIAPTVAAALTKATKSWMSVFMSFTDVQRDPTRPPTARAAPAGPGSGRTSLPAVCHIDTSAARSVRLTELPLRSPRARAIIKPFCKCAYNHNSRRRPSGTPLVTATGVGCALGRNVAAPT
jgi:hypothetical protein